VHRTNLDNLDRVASASAPADSVIHARGSSPPFCRDLTTGLPNADGGNPRAAIISLVADPGAHSTAFCIGGA
jgi:hypothetical protein